MRQEGQILELRFKVRVNDDEATKLNKLPSSVESNLSEVYRGLTKIGDVTDLSGNINITLR